MTEIEFDFKQKIAEEEARLSHVNVKKEKLRKIFYVLGFLVAVFIIFSATMVIAGDGRENWYNRIPFFGQFFGESADKKVMGEEDDRVNILLLGMGGKNHDGAYLTDTMILASLKPSTKQVALFSIPRDLSIPFAGNKWQKINSINAYAEQKKEEGGLVTSQAVSELLEIPIHYYIRADFDGFVNIIDEMDGIDVEVDNTFDDYTYPADGQENNPDYYARFEHLHFDKGLRHMNGTTALKYTRSRHSLGPEGSDFARGIRQQKVISATKEKLLQKDNLLKPAMLGNIISQLNDHVATNISVWEGIKLWGVFKDMPKENIHSEAFSDAPDNFLRSTQGIDGAFLLVPKTGNFADMKNFVKNIFTIINPTPTLSDENIKTEEKALIEIKNGTNINGLGSEVADNLKKANFDISKINNATKRDFKQATIYDLTYGGKNKALDVLKAKTGGIVEADLPTWLIDDIKTDTKNNPKAQRPDFILVVGENNRSATSTN
jgi:LCP family protein required for cell wall assembly